MCDGRKILIEVFLSLYHNGSKSKMLFKRQKYPSGLPDRTLENHRKSEFGRRENMALICTKIAPIIRENTQKQGIISDSKLLKFLLFLLFVTIFLTFRIDYESVGRVSESPKARHSFQAFWLTDHSAFEGFLCPEKHLPFPKIRYISPIGLLVSHPINSIPPFFSKLRNKRRQ